MGQYVLMEGLAAALTEGARRRKMRAYGKYRKSLDRQKKIDSVESRKIMFKSRLKRQKKDMTPDEVNASAIRATPFFIRKAEAGMSQPEMPTYGIMPPIKRKTRRIMKQSRPEPTTISPSTRSFKKLRPEPRRSGFKKLRLEPTMGELGRRRRRRGERSPGRWTRTRSRSR